MFNQFKHYKVNNNFEHIFKIGLYIFVTTIVVITIFLAFNSANYTNQLNATQLHNQATRGIIDISGYDIEQIKPIELNGEWRKYSNVYFTGDEVNYDMLNDYTFCNFPIINLNESTGTATYQLYTKFNYDKLTDDVVVLGIPFLKSEVNVYINGQRVNFVDDYVYWDVSAKYTATFDLESYYDPYKEYQEIVISTNKSSNSTDLYGRNILISTTHNIISYQTIIYTLEFCFLGVILVTIFIGINYIVSRPYYNISTFINLFDIFLLLNILFSLTNIPNMLVISLSDFELSDTAIYRISLITQFFMLVCSNCLNQVIFDPEKKCPSFFDLYLNIIYICCAVCYAIYPYMYSYFGVYSLVVLMSLNFVGMIIRYVTAIKLKYANKYLHLHFALTLLTGVVVIVACLDFLVDLPITSSYVYGGYLIILAVHLTVRAYEYRRPFDEISSMNEELEEKIVIRTQELTRLNEELNEIATKDSLTKTYNRLHFENMLVKELDNFKKNYKNLATLHLAMFDLDNFKKINDTFGHPEGDQQLIDVANLVKEVIPTDVVFARIGGEEFVLLFVDYDDDEVFEFVEIIRCSLEVVSFKNKNRTTGSFGVTKAYPDFDRKTFFSITDDCLYHSKMHGKNCISHYVDGDIVIKKSDEINI